LRDQTAAATLSAITVASLGSTSLSIVPQFSTAGASGTLTLTILPLTNALASGDKLQFTLPSGWSYNTPSSTTCSLTHNAVSVSVSNVAVASQTLTITVGAAVANDATSTIVICTNIRTPTNVQSTTNSVLVQTFTAAGVQRDMSSVGTVPIITYGALGATMKTLQPASSTTGQSGLLTLTINQFTNALNIGDLIVFTLPTGWAFSTTSCSVMYGAQSIGSTTAVSGQTVTVTVSAVVGNGADITVSTCTNVRTPTYVVGAVSNIEITTKTSTGIVRDYTNAATIGAISASTFGSTTQSLIPQFTTAGAVGNLVVTITPTVNALISGDKIQFTLPSLWTLNSGGSTTCLVAFNNVSVNVLSTSTTGQIVTTVVGGAVGNDGSPLTLTCSYVMTPNNVVSMNNQIVIQTLTTIQSVDTLRDQTLAGQLSAITAGTLGTTTKTLVPASALAGSVGNLVVTIRPLTNALTVGENIKFTLPSSWALSSGASTSCSVLYNGSYIGVSSTSISNQDVTITVSSAVGNSAFDLILTCSNIRTPTSVTSATSVILQTLTSSGVQKDYTSAASLPQITVANLGSNTRSLMPTLTTTGASGNLVITINQLSNALVSGDQIVFTLPALWTFNSPTSSVCTIVHSTSVATSSFTSFSSACTNTCRYEY
jgi:hypothetical protein